MNVNPRETEVIWLMPIENMEYVRESSWLAPTKTKPPRSRLPGVTVGYTALSHREAGGASRSFNRRRFYLKDYDRHFQPEGEYETDQPCEAVSPMDVRPGEITPRYRGAK